MLESLMGSADQRLKQANGQYPDRVNNQHVYVGLYRPGCSTAYDKHKIRLEDLNWRSPQTDQSETMPIQGNAPSSNESSHEEMSRAEAAVAAAPSPFSPIASDDKEPSSHPRLQPLQSAIRQWAPHVKTLVQQQIQSRWGIIKATTAGLAIAACGAGAYVVTRPCVIGPCHVLETARSYNQESQALLDHGTSPEDIVEAYEKLLEANFQLEQIPFWSDYYDQAQAMITQYQQEADLVSQVVVAQRQAYEATMLAQEPPYPLPVWEDIRVQWQEAIAKLESIPSDTDVANLANLKLTEYQTHLSAIDQHIRQEQEAQAKISEARETAQIAEARERAANSPESWNYAYVTWQVVMLRLAEIPKDTMAYAEAQHLNAIYEARLMTSKERNTREQNAHNAYMQATALANEAIALEQSGQLTQATVAWQNALSNIEQIPEGSRYFEQAQPLLSSYTEELARTEQALNALARLEGFRSRLNQACSTGVSLCSYALAPEGIDIIIAPSHSENVRQLVTGETRLSAETLENGSDDTAEAKLVVFLRALESIGDNSELPITLYDQSRQRIATYDPTLGQYRQSGVSISQRIYSGVQMN
jgi:hypothetical protein